MYRQMIPARLLVDSTIWPNDLLASDRGESLLDSLYVVASALTAAENGLTLDLLAVFAGELTLSLPGLDAVSVVLGMPPPTAPAAGRSGGVNQCRSVRAVGALWREEPPDGSLPPTVDDPNLGAGWTEVAAAFVLTAAGWSLALRPVTLQLRFTESFLRPLDGGDSVAITLRGDVALDSEFDITVSGFDSFDLAPCEIGQTGLILSATGVVLDLARRSSPPEIMAGGFDAAFVGVYLATASVQLPDWLTTTDGAPISLSVSQATIGSGGFAGTLRYSGGALAARLGGFAFTLTSAELTFVQNTLTGGGLSGQLTLPFFDTPVAVTLGLGLDGSVQVAVGGLTGPEALLTVPLGAIGELRLSSLALDIGSATPAIELSGVLAPGALDGLDLPTVSVDGLRIAADGTIGIDGVGLTLPGQLALDLYGFSVEVAHITLGSEPRSGADWNWIGFSGTIRLGETLPSATATIRLLWERGGNDFAIACDGVGVSFSIPNVLEIDGALSLSGQEFQGDILFKLSSLDLAVTANLIAGHQTDAAGERFTYFKVELDASLPLGIPLGMTGLSLYGLGGLFASNMVPDQAAGPLSGDEFSWYHDWFIAWEQPWQAQRGGVGLGASVTLGTAADNGFSFATRVALIFSFPGPIIMLQGVGNLLRLRSALPDESTFTALILFDGQAGDILAALGIGYQLPAEGALTGKLLTAGGTAEAYFDFNDPANWHVYLGQEPPAQRIRAEALTIFEADAYLMLEQPTLRAGASIGFDERYDFEVVVATFKARLEGEGAVSWAPQHLAGTLGFSGELSFSAFGFGAGLSLEAEVSAETPAPFAIEIELEVELDLPWPLPELTIDVDLAWDEPAVPLPVSPLPHSAWLRDFVTTAAWPVALSTEANSANDQDVYRMLDGQPLTVPLDARPALVFNRNVEDVTLVGTPRPATLPEVVTSPSAGDHAFHYRLGGLILQQWAMGPQGVKEWTGDSDVIDPASGLTVKGLALWGSWQATGTAAGTELELYGDGPFSLCRETISLGSGQLADAPAWTPYADGYLSLHTHYPDATVDVFSVDFERFAAGQNLGTLFVHQGLTFEQSTAVGMVIEDMAFVGGAQSLQLLPLVSLFIHFPEPVSRLVLPILAWSQGGFGPRGLVARGILADGQSVLQTVDLGAGLDPPTLRLDIALEERFARVTSLELRGLRGVYLLGVRYVTAAQLDAIDALTEAGQHVLEQRPLLLPDTDYRLTLRTETATSTPSGSDLATATHYVFFRTAGPPADLLPYLASAVPTSTDAPHFAAYDLRVVFNQNYVLAMYGGELTISISDDNERLVLAADGGPILTFNQGGIVATLAYTQSIWLAALAEAEVVPTTPAEPAPNDLLVARLAGPTSLPSARRLTARLVYRSTPVLSLPFVTARYADFAALVADFSRTIWNEALPAGQPTPTAASELQTIAHERAGALTAYTEAEGALGERVLYELLGSPTRPRPERPQLVALRAGSKALALLLELPEPVGWTRLSWTLTDGRRPLAVAAVRSTDGTRAVWLLPGRSAATEPKAWAAGTYTLALTYMLDPGDGGTPILSRQGSSLPERPPAIEVVLTQP